MRWNTTQHKQQLTVTFITQMSCRHVPNVMVWMMRRLSNQRSYKRV